MEPNHPNRSGEAAAVPGRRPRPIVLLAAFLLAGGSIALSAGCVKRRISIASEPPGALVWLNDAQVGRTPVEVGFTYHGVYDLRIEKEGFEPLVTHADTDGPVWDEVPLDFFAEVLPADFTVDARWKFKLVPRDDSEAALLSRAQALRDRLGDARTGADAKRVPGNLTPAVPAAEPARPESGDAALRDAQDAVEAKPADATAPRAVPQAAPPAPGTPPAGMP